MKIIFHLIDLSIVDGWLLYRRHCFQLRLTKNEIRSLLQFRMEVAEALLKPIIPQRPIQRGRPSRQSIQLSSSERRLAAYVRPPPASIRLDGFDHWPISTTKGRCRNLGCNIFLKIKANFSILTHYGRLLPFGNIVVFS
jgi:hypothetical protein